MLIKPIKLTILIGFFLLPNVAAAYVGPGVGAGVMSAVLGVLGAIVLLLGGIVYFPIKRYLKKRKSKNKADE